MMTRFHLLRTVDPSGVSGTGLVAEGVEFSNGGCVIHWFGPHQSIVVWESIADVLAIHGHDGDTTIQWLGLEDWGSQ